jgi:phenylacetate-CoA ligase
MFPILPESVVRNVIYPVYRGFRNDRVLDRLDRLEHDQFLNEGEIGDLRWRRLRRLLESAARFVPYYEALFERAGLDVPSFGGPADMDRIPFLTIDTVIREKDGLISKDPMRKGYRGSGGEGFEIWCDSSSAPLRRASSMRGYRWTGFDIGRRQALLWEGPAERIKNFFNNILLLPAGEQAESDLRRHAGRLSRFKPALVTGYPSALARLCGFCRENGLDLPAPLAVVTGGEMLHPESRALISEVFGAPVYERYGRREFSVVAHECPEHRGLHVFDDLFHVEVIREDGGPAAPGESGELVVTDLSNFYMPLVRFRTGDIAVRGTTGCACGRNLSLLERIEKRTQERGGQNL